MALAGVGLLAASVAGRTTAEWLAVRNATIGTIWDDGLPTRDTPDYEFATNVSGLRELIWDVSSPFFPLNSTTYYMPAKQGQTADCVVLEHHGHAHGCAAAGCTWWDYYNVSSFIHVTLGCDYYMLYMPLYPPNTQHGYPVDHSWFEQWEKKGDKVIRYFVEPVILTINHAKKMGYKTVYMMGKSGGGWTTSLAAAIDPRIKVSFPIAGSIPLNFKHKSWDFEQIPQDNTPGWYLSQCNYTCQYTLGGLEAGRYQIQILHENDPCCYYGKGRHDRIIAYNDAVEEALSETGSPCGGFTTAISDWNKHEICPRDRQILTAALYQATHKQTPDFTHLPCDILRANATPCPEPPPPALLTAAEEVSFEEY
eukprot:TRINITY_DN32698_c0_g1_i1.p1 TRINITY_DN32698_c0_g1~~TRINITY_DN32698_c0_g1_i1.p1  ORF type:complete len:388 (+),score=111.27 TRINITY_DN32698_c0_g1_i1:65-1165(+)